MEIYRREFKAQRQTRSPGEMGREEDITGVWQFYIGRRNFLKGGMTTLWYLKKLPPFPQVRSTRLLLSTQNKHGGRFAQMNGAQS